MSNTVETSGSLFESAVAAALGPYMPGAVFLAAVSGGADSTAMLLALARLRETRNFTFRCIHVEHGIRPAEESRGDAEAVKALCGELKVPCKVASIPPGLVAETAKRRGLGIEAAARHYRHGAWGREARRIGVAAVLVAHTRDDALETALMRVLRGSGPAGLAAMPAARGLIRRPLLGLGRADVLRYLAERGVPYRTDSTNRDNQYLRNRLRNRLIPLLDELFPCWKKGLGAMAETQGLAAAFLSGEARRRVAWEGAPGVLMAAPGLRTDAGSFFFQPEIIREEALFQGVDLVKKAEDAPVRRSSLRLFSRERGSLDLGFCRISVKGPYVVIGPGKNRVEEAGFSLLIKEPGIYKLKEVSLEVRPLGASDPGKGPPKGFRAALPLVLRPGFKGDFVVDRAGRRVSLAGFGGGKEFQNGGAVSAAVDERGIAAFIGAGPGGAMQILCREEGPGASGSSPGCGDDGYGGDSGDPSFFVALSHNYTGGIDA
jgi:tRNA(Ile)-lysidine synthase